MNDHRSQRVLKDTTFIDLFSGIGGFRYALAALGAECIFSSEIDPKAREAYRQNYGDLPNGDILKIPSGSIPPMDVICAGFPCQPWSISGRGEGLKDPRGKLFHAITRIARHHKPKLLFLENSPRIVTHAGGESWKKIKGHLGKAGYNTSAYILNASDFGQVQSRKRVYIICIRKDLEDKIISREPQKYCESSKVQYLENVLEKTVSKDLWIDLEKYKPTWNGTKEENRPEPIRTGTIGKGGQGERIYSPKGHAITLTTSGGGVGRKTGLYHIGEGVRRLSLTECKRVQGFPDSYCTSGGEQGKAEIGNSVIPGMVSTVLDTIGPLNKEEAPPLLKIS